MILTINTHQITSRIQREELQLRIRMGARFTASMVNEQKGEPNPLLSKGDLYSIKNIDLKSVKFVVHIPEGGLGAEDCAKLPIIVLFNCGDEKKFG